MTLGTPFLLSFFSIYIRLITLIFSSSLFGKSVPKRIKFGFVTVFAFALSPIVQPYVPISITNNFFSFIAFFFNDLIIGLVLGFMVQILFAIYQTAGSIIDLQIGLGNAQLLDPLTRVQASIIGQLKAILGMVLFFVLNGHHYLFQALIKSYHIKLKDEKGFFRLIEGIITFFSESFLFALQIAVPIIAISFILDFIAGIMNKSMPQMQVFFINVPLKVLTGLFMLILLLPYFAGTVQLGIEKTFRHIYKLWEK